MLKSRDLVSSAAQARRSESADYRAAVGAKAESSLGDLFREPHHTATSRFGPPQNPIAVNLYSVPDTEFIEITNYPTELLEEVEHASEIGILYTRWRSLGEPPHKSKFHPGSDSTGYFCVSGEHPLDFVFTSMDEPTQSMPIRELDSEPMRKQAIDDLVLVKETSEPLYQQVIHRVGPTEMCFRRVLLPVVDDDGYVELIYSATRRLGALRPKLFGLVREFPGYADQSPRFVKRLLSDRRWTALE